MNESKDYGIRPLSKSDQAFLWEMLYQSLYVPDGHTPFDREIINQPEISKYVNDWGRESDFGFAAIDVNDKPVGAIWLRHFKGEEKGFGYVDDNTPELGMAVLPGERNKGIGSMLLSHLIKSVKNRNEYISLSVAIGNPAFRLYKRIGFEIVKEYGNSIIMKKKI